MVGKALAWEQSPPATSAPFWNNVLLAAEFEDDDSNDKEDRWFTETSEAFRRYYNLQWPNINVSTVYINNKFGSTANSRALKHNSSSILNTSSSAFQMPASGDTASGSSSGSTTRFVTTGNGNAEVVAGINAGAALVLHRDHGGYGGWGLPTFGASDATALTNGNLTPLFLSFECSASAIDHDTLALNMLKHTNNGAHAVIGASRTSYSGYNDWMAHGFLNCLTGNVYDRLSTLSGFRSISYAGNPWSGRSDYGSLLNCAKKTMYDMEGAGAGDNEKEYELFHLYGDPETSVRTNAPAAVSATSTRLAINYQAGNGGAGQSTVSFTIKNPKAQYSSSQAALTEDADRLHFFPLEGPVLASTSVAAPAPTSAAASITVAWGTGTAGENRYIASALDHLNLTVTSRNGIPYQARVPISVDAQAAADYTALQSQFVSYWNTSGKYAANSGAPCLSTYEVSRTLTHTNGSGFASSTYQCAVACPSQQIATDARNNPVCTCAADGSCPANQECNGGLCSPCGEIDEMICSTGAPCRDGVQVDNICRAIAANTPTGCSSGTAYMLPGEGLYENQSMLSCDGRFRLYMQGDGNLVLSQKDSAGNFSKALWTSQTNGVTMELVVMQGDGNLVLYAPDFNPPWATHTNGNDGVHLKLYNDGNMKIYSNAAGTVWTSNTGGH